MLQRSRRLLTSQEKIAIIERVAATRLTTGIWFTWGPRRYTDVWAQKAHSDQLLEYALTLGGSKGFSQQGPGLYIAETMWRSSVYATEVGGALLIVMLNAVPTIDMADRNQIDALIREGVIATKDDLYDSSITGRFLLRYSPGWARLTASRGVTMTHDLRVIPRELFNSESRKCGSVAKEVLEQQMARILREEREDAERRDVIRYRRLEQEEEHARIAEEGKQRWYDEQHRVMVGMGLIKEHESVRPLHDHSSSYIS